MICDVSCRKRLYHNCVHFNNYIKIVLCYRIDCNPFENLLDRFSTSSSPPAIIIIINYFQLHYYNIYYKRTSRVWQVIFFSKQQHLTRAATALSLIPKCNANNIAPYISIYHNIVLWTREFNRLWSCIILHA